MSCLLQPCSLQFTQCLSLRTSSVSCLWTQPRCRPSPPRSSTSSSTPAGGRLLQLLCTPQGGSKRRLYVIGLSRTVNVLTEYQICFLLFSSKEEEESSSSQDIKFFSFSLIDGYISLVMDAQAQRRYHFTPSTFGTRGKPVSSFGLMLFLINLGYKLTQS